MAAPPPERLIADLESAEFKHGVRQGFWKKVEQEGSLLYVRVLAADDRAYLAQLDCTGYGEDPIACRFVDPATRQCVATAWPQGNGTFGQWIKFQDGNLFICWDQDRLGIGHHQEWRGKRAWTRSHNQLVAYLDFLRQMLHVPARGYTRCTIPG